MLVRLKGPVIAVWRVTPGDAGIGDWISEAGEVGRTFDEVLTPVPLLVECGRVLAVAHARRS
jgi:hypothetical protein